MISAADSDALVDPAWVGDHLDDADVRIVEVDVSPANYNEGHIPGAVLWNAYGDLRDAAYRPVSLAEFEQVLSRSGISEDTTVVLYGYGAFLGFWLMKAHGHPRVRMLNGDRESWGEHGGSWSTDVPAPAPTSYRVRADPDLVVSRDDVQTAIDDPGRVIVDVRSLEEFRGDRFWPSGATADVGRAGRIPHAVLVPIDMVRDEAGAIKGADELRRIFADAGVLPEQRVIVYCTIGNRASLAWFILTRTLGYPDVAVYQGSWAEWGKLPDAPVEVG